MVNFMVVPASNFSDSEFCGICQEDLREKTVAVHTGGEQHPFHQVCMWNWSLVNQQCPSCQQAFDRNKIFTYKQKVTMEAVSLIKDVAKGILVGAPLISMLRVTEVAKGILVEAPLISMLHVTDAVCGLAGASLGLLIGSGSFLIVNKIVNKEILSASLSTQIAMIAGSLTSGFIKKILENFSSSIESKEMVAGLTAATIGLMAADFAGSVFTHQTRLPYKLFGSLGGLAGSCAFLKFGATTAVSAAAASMTGVVLSAMMGGFLDRRQIPRSI